MSPSKSQKHLIIILEVVGGMDSVTHRTGQLLSGPLERNEVAFDSDGGKGK